jgi:drug/metabolite transporter (DMT)-like permease
MIKRLTASDAPLTVTIYAYMIMGGISVIPALFTWHTPNLLELGAVVAMGVCSALGQTSVAYALRAGDATAVTPFEYSRLLWAVLFGFILFAEIPAASTWAGGAIIVASSLYIAFREAKLAKSAKD